MQEYQLQLTVIVSFTVIGTPAIGVLIDNCGTHVALETIRTQHTNIQKDIVHIKISSNSDEQNNLER